VSNILFSTSAPAQDAVEYEIKRFHRGFGDRKTIYQSEPGPEVDQAWEDLYNGVFGVFTTLSGDDLYPNIIT
jgi:hypothetical protein